MAAIEVVPTNVRIERQLVESTVSGAIYVYRLAWESLPIIEVHAFVPNGTDPDEQGISQLMRACP